MKIRKRLSKVLKAMHLKSTFRWLPLKSESLYVMIGCAFIISEIWQACFYTNNLLSNIPLWVIKCYLLGDGTRATLHDVLNMWFYHTIVRIFYLNVLYKEAFISRSYLVRYHVSFLNIYSATNVIFLLLALYEKRVTIFANKVKLYYRYFGRYDIPVSVILRKLIP